MCIMAAVLRIINPGQFFQCFELPPRITACVPVNHRREMLDLLEFWASPFHCMQVIVNRETLNHRDTRGWAFGYDLLATFGRYTNGILDLPSIGLTCAYNPGTITGLMGKVLIHGVKPVNGERFCFAQFVRPGVFARAFPDMKQPQPPHLLDIGARGNTADFKWEVFQGTSRTYMFTPMSIKHEL